MKKAELAALLVEWGVTSFECKGVSRGGASVTRKICGNCIMFLTKHVTTLTCVV
jgi:hypothetical protein